MALEHRISFRVLPTKWMGFQECCDSLGITPSQFLRSVVDNFVETYNRKGGGFNLEEFVYAYVDWLPGMTFRDCYEEAVQRDREAADQLLQDITNKEV